MFCVPFRKRSRAAGKCLLLAAQGGFIILNDHLAAADQDAQLDALVVALAQEPLYLSDKITRGLGGGLALAGQFVETVENYDQVWLGRIGVQGIM